MDVALALPIQLSFLLPRDQEARQEIVEILEEEDGDDRQEETVNFWEKRMEMPGR